MKSLKSNKGFTLVELVVVIAILGILAGIAIPRFLDATASARGAKIVADMRTIESAQTIYFAKYSKYPSGTADTNFTALVQGGWPKPPTGSYTIAPSLDTTKKPYDGTVTNETYTFNRAQGATTDTPGTIELGSITLTTLLSGK